jgi:type IV pilus assembly protein PilC
MAEFRYKAIDEHGKVVKGMVIAANEIELEQKLQNLHLFLVSCREIKGVAALFVFRVPEEEIIIFCMQMEELIGAGVPLLDCLADLRDTLDNVQLKGIVADLHQSVKNGSMLSAAMAHHPTAFDGFFIGLIETGEKTGKLAESFVHLANHIKWVVETKSKVRKAIYYPGFVMALMFVVIGIMMTYVVPKLAEFLLSQDIELPFYSSLLIDVSKFVSSYWYLIITVPLTLFVVLRLAYKNSEKFEYKIDKLMLHIPIIGNIIRKIEMARFCRFFSITFRSGIGLLECLDIAGQVVANKVIRDSIIIAKQNISDGSSFSKAIEQSEQFPLLVVRMIKVGEENGMLDVTLDNVNFFYDREVLDSVDRLVGAINPALTIILGGLMLWVSLAVFGPLYSSFSKMNL